MWDFKFPEALSSGSRVLSTITVIVHLLGLFVVDASCSYLTDPGNSMPSKVIRQDGGTPTYMFVGKSESWATKFSIWIKSPAVTSGPTATSTTWGVTFTSQFPPWFCGLAHTQISLLGTTWAFANLPYICQSGGHLTTGGQGADGYSCSHTRLQTNGLEYPCCASGGSCVVPITTCITSPTQSMASNADPRAITCSTCLTIDIDGATAFDCYNRSVTPFSNYQIPTTPVTSITVVNTEILTTVFLGRNPFFTNDDTSSNKWSLAYPLGVAIPQATGTKVVDDLAPLYYEPPPSCANAMKNTCPPLYFVVSNTSGAFDANYFLCSSLTNNSCHDLCGSGVESIDWLKWVHGTCAGFLFFTRESWLDDSYLESVAHNSLFPWGWRVESTDPSYPCPSNGQKLASFAVVNVIMSICNLILGRRDVVQWMTFHRWGREDSYPYFWPFLALLTVSLNLMANFVNALLVKRAPGFHQVPLADLALFWFTRPRLAWMATALVRIQQNERIYTSLAATSLMAEAILQGLGAFYLASAAIHGFRNGLFQGGRLDNVNQGTSAQLMYAGALMWLVTVWVFYARVLWTYTSIGRVLMAGTRKVFNFLSLLLSFLYAGIVSCCSWALGRCYRGRTATATSESEENGDSRHILPDPDLGLGPKLQTMAGVYAFMFLPFVGQWLFWVGFVGLAGNNYCPLPLWKMAGVWSGFGAAGVFFGASH